MTRGRPRARRWLTVAATGVCIAAWLGAALSAHPTAASSVVINLQPAGIAIVAVTTEAEPLLMKLAALGGTTIPTAGLTPAAIDQRLRDMGSTLLAQVSLRFDDTPASLTITSVARVKDRPELVQITFGSKVPPGAVALRWRTELFFGSYPLAVRAGSGLEAATAAERYEWLSGRETSQPYVLASLAPEEGGWTRMGRLIAIGFTHIVPGGLDHVLFVLGLFLLAANTRTLLWQVSAFTVAHSLTLALAVTGLVSVPGRIVEPLIAASIAYVAIENLFARSVSRWRLAVVFVFGLLHGLGFAEALASLGLSRAHLATTLVGFNVGVEVGQVAVVLAAAFLVRVLRLTPEAHRRVLVRPASAIIAAAGIFWAVERMF